MKLVEVYKSSRKPGTYLYVERGSDLAELPEGFREAFGAPERVLSLKLTRRIDSLPATPVLRFLLPLTAKVSFLQLPPQHWDSARPEAEPPC